MTRRAQRACRAGARRSVETTPRWFLLCTILVQPLLAACSIDDRVLERGTADGSFDGSGFLQPLEAGSGGSSQGTGGHRGSGGHRVLPPPDGSLTDAFVTDAVPFEGGGGGCYHTSLDGSLDCDSTLLSNADFNRSIAGWEGFSSRLPNDVEIARDSRDSQNAKASGSISVKNTSPYADNDGLIIAAATQCVPVTSGETFDFSVDIFIPKGQLPLLYGIMAVWFYKDANCGTIDAAYQLLQSDVVGKWQYAGGQGATVPDNDTSMQVLLQANKPWRWADPTEVLFDAVRVVKRPAP